MAQARVSTIARHLAPQGREAAGTNNVEILGEVNEAYKTILTPDATTFLAELARKFELTRRKLIGNRKQRLAEFSKGALPEFLPETAKIREGDWKCAPIPKVLVDRRVEITGPTTRKMVINALNSGATCFMADLEDSSCPTWDNVVDGQINLRDAVNGTISLVENGKKYALAPKTSILWVRPRGWHLLEKHFLVDGAAISASMFDFGLFFYHNARAQINKGQVPCFYLPKMESHLEARLWNDIFVYSQERLGIPRGSIRATVLIETILGSFEMDEILYELREHSAGLNCGRWDYIFSFIKKFADRPDMVLPERSQVTMTQPFMQAYVDLLIKTCHRRGVHAMGGMSATIPIRDDEKANKEAMDRVRADKVREASAGHDGTWVAHPGLVQIAKEVFDKYMPTANQITVSRKYRDITAREMLIVPQGSITEGGLRNNIAVAIQYMECWLRGIGCVPLFHLMEDLATAEIARSQIWSWLKNGSLLADGRVITPELVKKLIAEEALKITKPLTAEQYKVSRFSLAVQQFQDVCFNNTFVEFLPDVMYDHVLSSAAGSKHSAKLADVP